MSKICTLRIVLFLSVIYTACIFLACLLTLYVLFLKKFQLLNIKPDRDMMNDILYKSRIGYRGNNGSSRMEVEPQREQGSMMRCSDFPLHFILRFPTAEVHLPVTDPLIKSNSAFTA